MLDAYLVSDDAQHWNTPNTMPPLVMSSKKLLLVQAFQHAAQNSDMLSPATSRVTPCEADGATFGIAGVNTQKTQDATDLQMISKAQMLSLDRFTSTRPAKRVLTNSPTLLNRFGRSQSRNHLE